MNKTAREIAKQYEQAAIQATDLWCTINRTKPFDSSLPRLARLVGFSTTMQVRWMDIADLLEKKPVQDPEIYDDGWELGQ